MEFWSVDWAIKQNTLFLHTHHGNGKSRAAIVLTNNTIDALLITQHADSDTVLLEIQKGNKKYYAVSIYMDYNDEIENSLKKI